MPRYSGRAISFFFAILLALLLTLPCSAGDASAAPSGEVIYRQDFAVCDRPDRSGVRFGTLSSPQSYCTVDGGTLLINGAHSEKTYLLLPTEVNTDTYTVEVTLAVADRSAENGYVAVLVSGWGSEPRNRTEVTVRQNGKVDGFSPLSSALSARIGAGEEFTVKIEVRSGLLYEVEFSSGDRHETAVRDGIKSATGGSVGLTLRNLSVRVSRITVTNGVDFDAYSGDFAERSYSELHGYGASACGDTPYSQPTADRSVALALRSLTAIAAAGTVALYIKFSVPCKVRGEY